MNLKLPTPFLSCLVLLITLAASAAAQPKRQTPARPQQTPAPTPVPTPPPTLETLLPADSYRVYGEVRSVGQLIKSNSVNEILEPILELAAPPKEFRTVVKWLNLHADEVVSSRLVFAAWASSNDIPAVLVAIEFGSPEEASKCQQQLNPFLKKMIAAATPTPADESNKTAPNKTEPPPPPPYYIQQTGSLVLITPTPLDLKQLRPAGSKLLADDANFRIARNRLNTESIFFFYDVNGVMKEEQERMAKYEAENQKLAAEKAADPEPPETPKVEPVMEPEEPDEPPVPESSPSEIAGVIADTKGPSGNSPAVGAASPSPFVFALSMMMSNLGNLEEKPPAAVGVGLSLEGESFDVRALLINAPGEKSDVIPFLPVLIPGAAIAPEAPNILPSDTETLVSMSLDLPQIYATMSTPRSPYRGHGPQFTADKTAETETESPFASIEKQLKIKIKDDLLPLLGSEIAVSIPTSGMGWFEPPQPPPSQPSPSPSPVTSPEANAGDSFTLTETKREVVKEGAAVVVAISLKDKEGMRALLPKIIENVAFKGASALAQTERREDTELISYVNTVAYAFIGNFLVISPDVKAVRHVVDSYLKHETLSGEPHFKNYTRWQPRLVQGQLYISPSLMESYRTWIQQPNTQINEQTRAFLTRFSVVAQPVTYSLSNEGFGPLHELHVPKNLVLLMVAAASGFSPQTIDVELQTPDPKPPIEQQPKLPAQPKPTP
jgi:uncharacterized protein DUF3352